eukprot:TRINITY_DN2133_c0_g1_i1.p2 TRINITY_DN2133_c0_g1~~TRINITY_DN2133_c0_g1_i1.p2  ORF type:complete len:83 (-),score=7.03 TRINITY_DN2133_c0_g1_i1:180-428(-)
MIKAKKPIEVRHQVEGEGGEANPGEPQSEAETEGQADQHEEFAPEAYDRVGGEWPCSLYGVICNTVSGDLLYCEDRMSVCIT